MMEDRLFIQCSCGFEGSSEVQDIEAEIGKGIRDLPRLHENSHYKNLTRGGESRMQVDVEREGVAFYEINL